MRVVKVQPRIDEERLLQLEVVAHIHRERSTVVHILTLSEGAGTRQEVLRLGISLLVVVLPLQVILQRIRGTLLCAVQRP